MSGGQSYPAKWNSETTAAFLATLDSAAERGVAVGGERALMAALLFDGIQSFIGYACSQDPEERSHYREAFLWVRDTKSDYVFSFTNVCECLGVNPDYLRCGLVNAANSQSFEWKKIRRNF